MTVDECIDGVMSRFTKPNLAYFEEVHQHLAPLARELELENAKLKVANKQWEEHCKLIEHKLITCGVAASHPDANLTNTGVYKEKWDSPQAEAVRQLRKLKVTE